MSDEAGLLLAIREHPSDDLPRMAWADWLEENGRGERAELVRLQLALARGGESGREREQALLAEQGQRWLDEESPGFRLRMTHEWMQRAVGEAVERVAFRRGTPSVLFTTQQDFLVRGLRSIPQSLLARVQLLDCWPLPDTVDRFAWFAGDDPGRGEIDEDLFERLSLADEDASFDFRLYPSTTAALEALSHACTAIMCGQGKPCFAEVFTTGQIAKMMNAAARKMGKWFDTGKLRGYRIPGSQDRRLPREQFIRFMRENRMPLGPYFHPWNGDLETFTG
ncbi:MAG: TIGR02996 domain-containing protein [Gemmataceae bacterium]|nr:TIGR02996 domain-containing protein [Gemmataceae bacterium]